MTAGTASEHGRDREGRSDGDSDAAHQVPAYLPVFKLVLAPCQFCLEDLLVIQISQTTPLLHYKQHFGMSRSVKVNLDSLVDGR